MWKYIYQISYVDPGILRSITDYVYFVFQELLTVSILAYNLVKTAGTGQQNHVVDIPYPLK